MGKGLTELAKEVHNKVTKISDVYEETLEKMEDVVEECAELSNVAYVAKAKAEDAVERLDLGLIGPDHGKKKIPDMIPKRLFGATGFYAQVLLCVEHMTETLDLPWKIMMRLANGEANTKTRGPLTHPASYFRNTLSIM